MSDSDSSEDKQLAPDTKPSSSEEERKLLLERMERWINDNLKPTYLYPEIDELFIKIFIQNFGGKYEYAKLIQSEIKKVIPKGRPQKNTNVKKLKILLEYKILKEQNADWNHQECLEYLAIRHGFTGENSWKKIQEIITAANKLVPNK